MRKLFFLLALLAPLPVLSFSEPPPLPKETVVLIHGLGRTHRSMNKAKDFFEEKGFNVLNVSYPSRKKTIRELALEDVKPQLDSVAASSAPVHFFTHSLGGILLRVLWEKEAPAYVGRVVMLSPPNGGTPLADKMRDWFLYRWVTGPAGLELGTGEEALPQRLPPFQPETGVIAGAGSVNPVFSWMISGDDDGKVSVESMKLEGMKDFIEVNASHTWMMRNEKVLNQALHFFQTGEFSKSESEELESEKPKAPEE